VFAPGTPQPGHFLTGDGNQQLSPDATPVSGPLNQEPRGPFADDEHATRRQRAAARLQPGIRVGSFPGSARAASQFDAVFFEQSSAKKGDCFLTKIMALTSRFNV
jgi:hypothetical protein